MSLEPGESTAVHTRLLKCALEIEDSRAYWANAGRAHVPTAEANAGDPRAHAPAPNDSANTNGKAVSAKNAFDEYWFGARSLARIEVLLANLRARFDAFPPSLSVLGRWTDMAPETRRAVCHWHVQLADPLYRAFTGEYLVERREGARAEVTRDLVASWVGEHGASRWTMATRIQFASKLLSAAYAAGLLSSNRDPRPIVAPRIPDEALEYLLYLLKGIRFEGSLLQNPYLASVGLEGGMLDERLRDLPGLSFSRQGDLVDFGWRHTDLLSWADARLGHRNEALCKGAP